MRIRPLLLMMALILVPAVAHGQDAGGKLSFDDFQNRKAEDIKPQEVINWEAFQAVQQADGGVSVTARMSAKQDWTIYSHNLNFKGPAGFTVAHIKAPPARLMKDPLSGNDVEVYAGGEFEVSFTSAVPWQSASFPFSVTYVGCTQVICLFPYTHAMSAPFTAAPPVAANAPAVVAEAAASTLPAGTPVIKEASEPGIDLESQLAKQLSQGGLSYGMLLGIVFLGGLLSNLTPCVYPMVPITLRVLGRQGHSPFISASAYALGIIITYSALGIAAALSGGLFGSLLASKSFNITFAIIMALLGLSMLGFGDFSKLQVLGSRLGSGRPSLQNTFLMGTGAGLVAAPCTGPILAALLVSTAKAQQSLGQSVALMFVYSLGFGLPYVLLGGAAARVSQVRVAPQVQVAVKMLFAAVMFGLSLYYLRIPLYDVATQLKPHWGSIASVGLALGLALTGVWVLAPKLQNNKAAMILPTLILGVGIFTGAQWATTAKAPVVGSANFTWIKEESEALAAAKAAGKPILIDMWAEWCEACKKMDATTFLEPEVRAVLSQGWVTLKLDLTESTPENDATQEKYKLQSLPTLVLLPFDGDLAKMQQVTGYVNGATLLSRLREFSSPAE